MRRGQIWSLVSNAAEITPIGEPPQLLCNNLSTLHWTINPVLHSRFKNIELDNHFFRDKVASRVLIARFLPSSLQVVDVFTKALPKNSFQVFRSKLGVHKLPLSSLQGNDKGNYHLQSVDKIRNLNLLSSRNGLQQHEWKVLNIKAGRISLFDLFVYYSLLIYKESVMSTTL